MYYLCHLSGNVFPALLPMLHKCALGSNNMHICGRIFMASLPVGVEDPHRLVFHQLTGNVGQRSSVWIWNDDDAMMLMMIIFKFHL